MNEKRLITANKKESQEPIKSNGLFHVLNEAENRFVQKYGRPILFFSGLVMEITAIAAIISRFTNPASVDGCCPTVLIPSGAACIGIALSGEDKENLDPQNNIEK